jgi:hypothetical protein
VILALLVGGIVLMGTVAFSGQKLLRVAARQALPRGVASGQNSSRLTP